MSALLLLLVVVVLVLATLGVLIGASDSSNSEPDGSGDYDARPYLLTKAERSYFGVLEIAVKDRYRVFAKVRIADLLKTRRGLDRSAGTSARNKITSKHVDFVLCTPDTLKPLLAIELDDRSHERDDRRARDDFVDRAFESAGVPLLRLPAKEVYSAQQVQQAIETLLRRQAAQA